MLTCSGFTLLFYHMSAALNWITTPPRVCLRCVYCVRRVHFVCIFVSLEKHTYKYSTSTQLKCDSFLFCFNILQFPSAVPFRLCCPPDNAVSFPLVLLYRSCTNGSATPGIADIRCFGPPFYISFERVIVSSSAVFSKLRLV